MISLQKNGSIMLLSKLGVLLLIPVILMFFNYSYSNVSFLVYGQNIENNITNTNTNSASKDKNITTTDSTSTIDPTANPTVGSIITFSNSPSLNSTGQIPAMELNNDLNNSNDNDNDNNNSNILTSPDALTNTSESNGYLPSSSSLPPFNITNADNVTGVQEGDGQEIDTGDEEEHALTVPEAQAIKSNLVIPDSSSFKSNQCIPAGSLEKFVPNPFMKDLNTTRFIVGNCITVTGKVTWTHYMNSDGDANFNIKLDKKYDSLLTPANNNKKLKGTLHIEVVCQGKNSSKDPVKISQCKVPKYDGPNFKKALPKIGNHVQVTGIYAIDIREGGHAELHPAYQIKRVF
jgi:hypothetical protein